MEKDHNETDHNNNASDINDESFENPGTSALSTLKRTEQLGRNPLYVK
jgi:hypothetical protein